MTLTIRPASPLEKAYPLQIQLYQLKDDKKEPVNEGWFFIGNDSGNYYIGPTTKPVEIKYRIEKKSRQSGRELPYILEVGAIDESAPFSTVQSSETIVLSKRGRIAMSALEESPEVSEGQVDSKDATLANKIAVDPSMVHEVAYATLYNKLEAIERSYVLQLAITRRMEADMHQKLEKIEKVVSKLEEKLSALERGNK